MGLLDLLGETIHLTLVALGAERLGDNLGYALGRSLHHLRRRFRRPAP